MNTTFYFKHDYSAASDLMIKRLMRVYGAQGYGVYWRIIEELYKSGDNRLSEDLLEDLAYDCQMELEAFQDVVKFILEKCGNLLFEEDGCLGSGRVDRAVETLEQESQDFIDARRKGGLKSGESRRRKAIVKQQFNSSSTVVQQQFDNTENTQKSDKTNCSSTAVELNEHKEKRREEIEIKEKKDNTLAANDKSLSADDGFVLDEDQDETSIFISLPRIGGKDFPVTQDVVDQYKQLYPAIDVEQQLRAMKAWLLSNPANGKKNISRFVNNWLSKQQDRTTIAQNQYATTDKPKISNSAFRPNASRGPASADGPVVRSFTL